jgi:hypothetical protein
MIQSIEVGRKEDGNRSIADKIIKRLHDLDKTVENNHGRWAWELLQNAKDSIADYEDRRISIQLVLEDNRVEFKHNGVHFTEKDVRGLINQISSKEVSEGEVAKKTGRFGTGFLTTHLLSRVINVRGILETVDKTFFTFEFPLDREGATTKELVPKIENAWSAFHASATEISEGYDFTNFNTAFSYRLNTAEQKGIARKGCDEFTALIPFVLAFIPKIERVEILDRTTNNSFEFLNTREHQDNCVLKISKKVNEVEAEVLILFKEGENVSIAAQLERRADGCHIDKLVDVPRLFCDFPLIGTEQFYIPVIVNSFYFNPQTERDGIWLKDKKDNSDKEVGENQILLEEAIGLYESLLTEVSNAGFHDLFNIAESEIPVMNEKYFDSQWYSVHIQKRIREVVSALPLIELEDPSLSNQLVSKIWFPVKSYSKALREALWKIIYDLYPLAVCKRSHMHDWADIAWEEWNTLSYATIVSTVSKFGNLQDLRLALKMTEKETLEWLNETCILVLKDESNQLLFEKNALIPNQNGEFKKKSELKIDEIEDPTLIEILRLLGEDWKKILLHKSIRFGDYYPKSKKDIGVSITEKLKGNFAKTEDSIKAISLLSEWFENNRDKGKELFSELYRRRAELFMNTIDDKESLYKVMRSKTNLSKLSEVAETLANNPELLESIQDAASLKSILSEFNINTIADLRAILQIQGLNNGNLKIEINQDALIGLGVTTLEELEEKLKDKDLAALFSHTSTPNAAMFLFVQKLIGRAKENVIKHLRSLPQYDLTEMEEVAKTIIGGIRKDGLEIHVVIRPSDNGEVIVYYNSEKDTLDFANAELWVENGVDVPKLLTLGKILKNTGINKIPVK